MSRNHYSPESYLQYMKQRDQQTRKYFTWKNIRTTPEEAMKTVNHYISKTTTDLTYFPESQPKEFKPIQCPIELPSTLRETIIGMILGQAVGDAVGLASEFFTTENSTIIYNKRHITYDTFIVDSHRAMWMNENFVCQDWTDDTDQCMCLLDSIVYNNGECNILDFAYRLKFWMYYGYPELGDLTGLDAGTTTSKVLSHKLVTTDPIKASEEVWYNSGEYSNGEVRRNAANGCVMRTSVGSIPYFWDEEKVIDNCRKWGMITHYDPRSRAAVIVTVLILSKLLQGRNDVEKIIEEAIQRGEKELNKNEIKDMHKYVYAKEWEELNLSYSKGYCWKPVGCAILTLKKAIEMKKNGMNDKQIFSDCLDNIVHQAGDADTNGCVTGACLGAYLKGFCIPDEWMELKHMNWLKDRINRMLRLYELEPIKI